MATSCEITCSILVQKNGNIKENTQGGKIIRKYDILIIQEEKNENLWEIKTNKPRNDSMAKKSRGAEVEGGQDVDKEYSLLILLCALVRLCEGNPPSTTLTQLLYINFPLHP